ncbi:MAG: thermopsin family protease, partial [Thermoplasmata archaeon]
MRTNTGPRTWPGPGPVFSSTVRIALLAIVVAVLLAPTGLSAPALAQTASHGASEASPPGTRGAPSPPPPSAPLERFSALRDEGGPLQDSNPKLPQVPPTSAAGPGSPSGFSNTLLPASFPALLQGSPRPTAGRYPSTPAPMGLSDLGVGSDGPYAYNATSFAANLTIHSFSAYSPGYEPWLEAPDWVTLSLDTVAIGLPINGSLPATPNGTFWAENAVRFNGTELQFEDNVWNFSAPDANLSASTLQVGTPLEVTSTATPWGQLSVLYYQHWGPSYSVTNPFTLTLINTVGVASGRPVLDFNFSLSSPGLAVNGSYDQVTFRQSVPSTEAPQFTVNGTARNPYGLRDDAEFVFAGDGMGSNGDIAALNGTAHLRYLDDGNYVRVPAAYDYGDDSGGTSSGIAPYYLGGTEYLNAGPSLLYGLWNTSDSPLGPAAPAGWIRVHVALQPRFGLLLATNQTAVGASPSGNFSYAPTDATGNMTTDLPRPAPGDAYVFEGWADGYDPGQASVSGNASGNVSLDLSPDPSFDGAPLYLNGDAQVDAFGESGGPGVAVSLGNDSLTIRDRAYSLSAPFRQLNDYLDPTFVLFAAENLANASVHLDSFVQDPTSFDYSWYGESEYFPNLTQSYDYTNDSGNSTVTGVDVVYPYNLPFAIGVGDDTPSIEFYGSEGGGVSNITSEGLTGVAVVDSTGFHATQLVELEGTGVEFYGSEIGAASNLSGIIGIEASIIDSEQIEVDYLFSPYMGVGVQAASSQNLTVDHVTVYEGTGIYLANLTMKWWNLSGQYPYTTCSSLYDGTGLFVTDLNSTSWFGGCDVVNWTDIRGWNISAWGYDSDAFNEVYGSSNGIFWNMRASYGANTMYGFAGDHDFHFFNLTGFEGGNVVEGYALSTDSTFENITATVQAGGFEGGRSDSYLTFTNVLSATGSEAVGGTNLSYVSFWNGTAYSVSLSLILLESQDVSVGDVHAFNGSVAVSLADTNHVTAWAIEATNLSVGISWWTGANGRVSNLTATNESIDAQLVGLGNVTVSGLNETNREPGPAYFQNPFLGISYPDGPLQTYSDGNLDITNLTAVNCSFALQDVYSDGITVSDVRSWQSGTAIQLNETEFATIDGLFAESDVHGLVLRSTLNITLAGSTIEDSSSYAIYLLAGLNETFYANNLVANNGASAFGLYEPSHPQVGVYLTQNVTFALDGVGNYWSDWSSPSPHPVGLGVTDPDPAPTFLSAWLDFAASGLDPGVRWGVAIDGRSYIASAPLIVIPSWVLPNGTYPFGVVIPPQWGATPRSGTVTYLGVNRTVTVQFTLPEYTLEFVASGLPSGTAWSVTLGGSLRANVTYSASSTISFAEPNGTYFFTVGAIPGYWQGTFAPGSWATILGANLTDPVPFEQVVYSLTWEESGLPLGMAWGVTAAGTFHGSNNSVIGWNAPNGSYVYNLSGVPGWHEDSLPYHGTLTVSNRSQVVQVVWYPVRYSITFAASGLPEGTSWTVVFAGQNLSLTAPTLSFDLPNGTYGYRVFATLPTTLSGTPPLGNVTISGGGTVVNVSFSAAPVVSSSGVGTAFYVGVEVAVVGVAAAVAIAV